ncbi:MAG: nitrite reductase [Flammeovirgaceae bacterium]
MTVNLNDSTISSSFPSSVSAAAQKDIVELKQKISSFKKGDIIEDKFKAYRLTRGVYGQRQLGVHMFRTKIPFGKLTSDQLIQLANVSEKYTHGNLHLTTRQNIQLHYVKLNDSPAIWTELAEKNVTAREACGNTVRNITGSAIAGIDPKEPFDISPYVQASFEYFLRNPICQDMGRKIKIAFSSNAEDAAFAYIHDFGFVPKIKVVDGKEIRGFEVLLAGGLGAQAMIAHTVYDFLEEDQIIPFMEAGLRVFDRYGERAKRMKARMKFLVKKIGLEAFLQLIEEERKSLPNQSVWVDRNLVQQAAPAPAQELAPVEPLNADKYDLWLKTNVFEQKQQGFYGVHIRVPLGDIHAEQARHIAALIKQYAADDLRLTLNQGILLRFVRPEALVHLFNGLEALGFAEAGFGTIADITACPGTDTCNLGVANSTGLSTVLSDLIKTEYPDLVDERNIQIKISGCMNSCGQHMVANIGFHGSSIKHNALVIPAMQVVIGGGVDPDGKGFIAEKVIKVPTKRVPDVVRYLLDDYDTNGLEDEYFNDYFRRQGKRYFYDLLKVLGDKTTVKEEEYRDWGQEENFIPEVGVGECAGVSYDMVASIIKDATEKISLAQESLEEGVFADSIYHSYAAFVIGAKAILLSEDISCNTHRKIIDDFQEHFVAAGKFPLEQGFGELVLQINQNEPSESFAKTFLTQAVKFVQQVQAHRENQLLENTADKLVIDNYYKA